MTLMLPAIHSRKENRVRLLLLIATILMAITGILVALISVLQWLPALFLGLVVAVQYLGIFFFILLQLAMLRG